jgi:YD repeat-containing protein
MSRKSKHLLGAAAGALGLNAAAAASETVTFTYDALGRLVAVATAGGPNDGLNVGTCYDRAGNRSAYTVATGGAPPACPPPPPPAGNQPPVTASDSLSVPQCASASVNVLANDFDPEGHTPLVLLSVTQGNKGVATIVSSATIQFEAGFATGGSALTYTVRDSLGATSTGTLNITVTSGTCN